MESDLHKLYSLLTLYRQSLSTILNKIDEKVHHALSNYEETHTKDSSLKKYKISMQMIEVLQNHIRVLHTYEEISETLTADLSQLDQDTQPERDDSYLNPFTLSPLLPSVKIEEKCVSPQIHISCRRENTHVGILTEVDGEYPDDSTQNQCQAVKIEQNCTPPESIGWYTEENIEVPDERDEVSYTDDGTQRQWQGLVINEQKIRFDTFVQELTDGGDTSDTAESSSDTIIAKVEDVDDGEDEIQDEECQSVEHFELEGAVKTEDIPPMEEPLSKQGVKPKNRLTLAIVPEKEIQSVNPKTQGLPSVEEPAEEGAGAKKRVTFSPDQTSKHRLPRYDWRRETVKLFEDKKLKVALRWTGSNDQTPSHSDDGIDQVKGGSFVIEEDDLSVGQRCIFSHIESPSEFYICTNQALLDSFEEHINDLLNKHWHNVLNNFKSKGEARERLGNFCFGFFSSRRKWYRVEVLDWMEKEPEKISVQLIDYGEKWLYSYRNLKGIADLLYSMFPKLAVRCQLAGIYSPHPSKVVWPQRTIEFFVELSEMNQRTEFEIIFAHRERDLYGVDLRKASDPDADTLGEVLVKNCYALEDGVVDDFLNTLNENDLKDDEEGSDEDASSEAKTDETFFTNKMDLPPPEAVIEIMVTGYILDSCHFYARILRNCTSGECCDEQFQRLVETMNANNVVQGYDGYTLFPEIGELVLVKDDSTWCRGHCVAHGVVQEVEVFLVDFGYTVMTPLRDLRKMKEEFFQVPFQAVECMLSNCQEKNDISDKMSRNFFDKLMKMKTFTALVVQSTYDVIRLQMWDKDNVEMSHVLKSFGLVEDR